MTCSSDVRRNETFGFTEKSRDLPHKLRPHRTVWLVTYALDKHPSLGKVHIAPAAAIALEAGQDNRLCGGVHQRGINQFKGLSALSYERGNAGMSVKIAEVFVPNKQGSAHGSEHSHVVPGDDDSGLANSHHVETHCLWVPFGKKSKNWIYIQYSDRRMQTKPIRTLVALALGLAINLSAHAWGFEGHQVVATIADKHLTPAARAQVDRLLALEPGETLTSISTWADEHRSPQTGAMHYVNFPRGDCQYVPERDCPDGRCVVGAIEREVQILGSNAPDEQRLTALKYLVHFVGDVHQPLHAGYQDDRGGNQYQLQAFMRGSNLHAVWDTGLIKSMGQGTEQLAARLGGAGQSPAWSPAQAAEESCRIVATPGFYPGRLVDGAYIDRFTPVMEKRLAVGGSRLAGLLNRVLR